MRSRRPSAGCKSKLHPLQSYFPNTSDGAAKKWICPINSCIHQHTIYLESNRQAACICAVPLQRCTKSVMSIFVEHFIYFESDWWSQIGDGKFIWMIRRRWVLWVTCLSARIVERVLKSEENWEVIKMLLENSESCGVFWKYQAVITWRNHVTYHMFWKCLSSQKVSAYSQKVSVYSQNQPRHKTPPITNKCKWGNHVTYHMFWKWPSWQDTEIQTKKIVKWT